jgi:hypothetical protein
VRPQLSLGCAQVTNCLASFLERISDNRKRGTGVQPRQRPDQRLTLAVLQLRPEHEVVYGVILVLASLDLWSRLALLGLFKSNANQPLSLAL